MKKYSLYLLLPILICVGSNALSQSEIPDHHISCVSEDDYQKSMLPLLQQSYRDLKAKGKLFDTVRNQEPELMAKSGLASLQWPLRMAPEYVTIPGVYDYFQIWNYADVNYDDAGGKLDWMCNEGDNARNYDNHNGVDIVPYPFRWNMLATGNVDVVAAADGEVLFLDDDNFDLNCGPGGHIMGDYPDYGHYGNFVALLHEDGSVTLYGHMKSGTVADLSPGDAVTAGQFLGKVGSSGNSSDPHLHFEVRECLECPYFEPWYVPAGCNTDVAGSWWADQRNYNEPQLLRVMTHYDFPDYYSCSLYELGTTETVKERNHFNSGDAVVAGVYLRDFLAGQALNVYIYNNSGVLQDSWSETAFENNNYGYAFNESTTMTGDPNGTYRLSAVFDGKTYNHFFTIGCTPSYTISGSHVGYKGYIASDFVSSTASISGVTTNEVLYEAGNYIQLSPGFTATANSKFQARLDACTVGGLKDEDDPAIVGNTLQIFPNPTEGRSWLYLTDDYIGECTLRFYNMQGNLIKTDYVVAQDNASRIELDLSGYAKGMYLVQIEGPIATTEARVVVQ